MSLKTCLTLGMSLALATAAASAHHSFQAEYDAKQPVTLTGKVTLLEWTNPHARLYLDVTDDAGNVVNWDLELGPPNGLMRQGWRRDSLSPGTVVTITGFLSRKEEHVANCRTVKLSDGREVFAGSSFDTTPSQ